MARGGGGGGRVGGGGGRSFGGGGGRSFGGRSGGSIGRGGGGLGSSGRGGSLGRMGGGPAHRPMPHNPLGHGHHGHGPHVHIHTRPRYGWGWRRSYGGHYGGGGCLPAMSGMFIIGILVIFVLIVSFAQGMSSCGSGFSYSMNGSSSSDVTVSTVKREALPRGSVVETAYYTDELDWISNKTKLTAGMKNFYQLTGVQPYLYITDTINGTHTPSNADAEAFAQAKYDALFSDEAHLLVIFFEYEPSQYHTWYLAGKQAKAVLDDEAMDILLDYIDLYYYGDYTDDEFFSKAFDDAGNRIMTVVSSPWIPVIIIVGVVVALLLLFSWWNKSKQQKNLEAEQTEKILNASLDSFGDKEAEERAKKYEDNNN